MADADADAVQAALVTAATEPKRAQDDAGEVEHHPLPDLIAAEKYLRGTDAASNARRGMRITRLIPGGTV